MNRSGMRRVGAVCTLAMLIGLAACGPGSASDASVTLTVWTSQEEQSSQDAWLQTMERAFEEEHPEYDITWNNAVVSSADAPTMMRQDPSAGADVYVYASDQLGTLLDAGAIGQMSRDAVEQIREQNDDVSIQTVTAEDGEIYGVPLSGNTWFMYYDASVYTEEDVRSFDALLAKGVVSFPMTNSWYLPAFYMGNGNTIFGEDGTDVSAGVDFSGEKASEVTEYLVGLRNNPNFVNDADGAGLAGIQNGTVDVLFSGSWDSENVKEALGEDFGAAQLPSYNLNGKQVQMRAFVGTSAAAWNPYSDHPIVADQFAAFLGTTDSQKMRYETLGSIPTDLSLSADPVVAGDPTTLAQYGTVSNTSVVQSTVAEMGDFWKPCENFGRAILNGDVTAANAAEKTEAWNSAYDSLK